MRWAPLKTHWLNSEFRYEQSIAQKEMKAKKNDLQQQKTRIKAKYLLNQVCCLAFVAC